MSSPDKKGGDDDGTKKLRRKKELDILLKQILILNG